MERYLSINKQRGILLVAAIAVVVVLAFIGLMLTKMYTARAQAGADIVAAKQALYLSASGLAMAGRDINRAFSTASPSCSTLTGNTDFTNRTLFNGQFTVTAENNAPYYLRSVNALSNAIGTTDTTITLSSMTGISSFGRVLIDNEIMFYSSTDTATRRLFNVKRGQEGTTALSHIVNARVGQYQCNLTATGNVPNSTYPSGVKRTQRDLQLQEAWVIGGYWWDNPTFVRWNGPAAPNDWMNTSSGLNSSNAVLPRGISMLNYADGWVVGDWRSVSGSRQFTIWRRSPSTTPANDNWTRLSSASFSFAPDADNRKNNYVQNLNSVSAVATNDAWAVGDVFPQGQDRYDILQWNGTTWCELSPVSEHDRCSTITIPADNNNNETLNSVSVIKDAAGDFGFAVGNNETILQFNGSNWSEMSVNPSGSAYTFNAVKVLSRTDAWLVGGRSGNGIIMHWNGSSWAIVSTSIPVTLNAIDMRSSTEGVAVGNSGRVYFYDGTNWTANNYGLGSTFTGAFMFAPDDVWVVGYLGGINGAVHWDGLTWYANTSLFTNQPLAISGARFYSQPWSFWREVIH